MTISEAFPAASHYIDGLTASAASLLKVKVIITEYCFILYVDLSSGLRRPTLKTHFSAAIEILPLGTNISQYVMKGANNNK